MKRIIMFITILVITLVSQNVYATNYNIKELIPVNAHTTIGTNNFRYIDFYYNDNEMEADGLKNNFIIFSKIKNVSDEKRAVTVSIGLFDKDKKNIGSLTSINCERIIAPVMENGIVTDYDKIYVLPKSYDRFKLEDLHSMIYDKRDLKEDLVYIKEADKLQREGYQIYANSDIYDVENNIKISCAYLRYLVDKKHDLIKGYMSYNVGLNRIDDMTTYDTILSGQIKTNNNGDVYYLNHIAQYILSDEESTDLTINFTDGTSQTLSIEKEDNLDLGATLK